MNKYERNVKKRDKAVRLVFYWVGSGERGINNKRVGAVLQSGSLLTLPTPTLTAFLNSLLFKSIIINSCTKIK